MWATNILYLNDSNELEHTKEIIKFLIDKHKDTISGSHLKNQISIEQKNVSSFLLKLIDGSLKIFGELMTPYVCSFSKEENDLNQWRAYCPTGTGVSLGFKKEYIEELIKPHRNNGISFNECLYEPNDQWDMIENLIIKFIGETNDFMQSAINENRLQYIVQNPEFHRKIAYFNSQLFKCSTQFKYHKFKSENEYRIIIPDIRKAKFDLKHRKGKSLIIPYVEFPLTGKNGQVEIEWIFFSTPMNNDLFKNSLESFMLQNNTLCKNIYPAELPYRWNI